MSEGLRVDAVDVSYDEQLVVQGVSLAIGPGEIVAVIGPSGCGKSTLLRAIAGLEPLLAGSIHWDSLDLCDTEPHRRAFGLMFQDHALFPHRDVGENVEFGLRMQHVDRAARRSRVRAMLELVGLDGFERRHVQELSGGEAQRVALARALAPRPRLVMLDEPLGSLDRSLRERLAVDIRTTVRALGVAALHVTHDQDEAFAVADRIAVMRAGRIVRDDAPSVIWRDPRTEFVARFLGHRDVISCDAATRLGLTVGRSAGRFTYPSESLGVVLLPGALTIDPGGPIEAKVVDVRFTSTALHVDIALEPRQDGCGVLRVIVPHGSAAAERNAVVVSQHVRLRVHGDRAPVVTLDQ